MIPQAVAWDIDGTLVDSDIASSKAAGVIAVCFSSKNIIIGGASVTVASLQEVADMFAGANPRAQMVQSSPTK